MQVSCTLGQPFDEELTGVATPQALCGGSFLADSDETWVAELVCWVAAWCERA